MCSLFIYGYIRIHTKNCDNDTLVASTFNIFVEHKFGGTVPIFLQTSTIIYKTRLIFFPTTVTVLGLSVPQQFLIIGESCMTSELLAFKPGSPMDSSHMVFQICGTIQTLFAFITF